MNRAGLEQDDAAGGKELRKLLLRNGSIISVSIYLREGTRPGNWTATMRFKMSGMTHQRPVGTFAARSRAEALKLAWERLKREKIAERDGWRWVAS